MSEPNPHGPDKDPHPRNLPEPPAPGAPEPHPAPNVFPIDHPRERPDGRPEIPPGDVPGGNHPKGPPMDIITSCANVLDAYLQANPEALRGSQRGIPVGQNQLRVIVRVVIGGFIKCGSVEPDATELLNAIESISRHWTASRVLDVAFRRKHIPTPLTRMGLPIHEAIGPGIFGANYAEVIRVLDARTGLGPFALSQLVEATAFVFATHLRNTLVPRIERRPVFAQVMLAWLPKIASRLDEELAGVVGVTARDARHPQRPGGLPSDAPHGARQAPFRSLHPVPA